MWWSAASKEPLPADGASSASQADRADRCALALYAQAALAVYLLLASVDKSTCPTIGVPYIEDTRSRSSPGAYRWAALHMNNGSGYPARRP